MIVSAQLLSFSLSGCGRKLVGFALKVHVSGDLWSPAVVPSLVGLDMLSELGLNEYDIVLDIITRLNTTSFMRAITL